MTLVLPSDADPGPVPPTPAPSSPPDFLAQLTAAQQADARLNSRGRELTDQEFLGAGQPNGTKGATPDLSHVSDADLQAIAAQGSSGATGRWSNAPMVHQWSNAPLARVKSRNFDDLARAFSPCRSPRSVVDVGRGAEKLCWIERNGGGRSERAASPIGCRRWPDRPRNPRAGRARCREIGRFGDFERRPRPDRHGWRYPPCRRLRDVVGRGQNS